MLPFIVVFFLLSNNISYAANIYHQFLEIEKKHHLQIGVYAHDTNSHKIISYRANQKFPFQSTCKVIAAAAMFKQGLAQKKVRVENKDLIFWHPISGKYTNKEVSLQTLAEGAISYSDNPATNIIINAVGGLEKMNQFAFSTGNHSFTIKHYESNLNSDPKIDEDTSTPKDMGHSLEKILFSKFISDEHKNLLVTWMRNNTTGYKRIRAGVPLGWAVADKTGSGSYGIANDIGIAWSAACKPVVLSIFTINEEQQAKPDDRIIAEVTKLIFDEFKSQHQCYKQTPMT
jgi:beta-lactamase class A